MTSRSGAAERNRDEHHAPRRGGRQAADDEADPEVRQERSHGASADRVHRLLDDRGRDRERGAERTDELPVR
jgi:hypothetical protein